VLKKAYDISGDPQYDNMVVIEKKVKVQKKKKITFDHVSEHQYSLNMLDDIGKKISEIDYEIRSEMNNIHSNLFLDDEYNEIYFNNISMDVSDNLLELPEYNPEFMDNLIHEMNIPDYTQQFLWEYKNLYKLYHDLYNEHVNLLHIHDQEVYTMDIESLYAKNRKKVAETIKYNNKLLDKIKFKVDEIKFKLDEIKFKLDEIKYRSEEE
jgi:hypothetical protein